MVVLGDENMPLERKREKVIAIIGFILMVIGLFLFY